MRRHDIHVSIRHALALFVLLPALALAEGHIVAADGFDAELSPKLWRFDKLAKGAAAIQSTQVRSGPAALEITLRPDDPSPEISAGDSERDELQEADRFNAQEGEVHEYRFSIRIPADFPIVDRRLVIAQWKQDTHGRSVKVDNPVVALRYVGGELSATVQDSAEKRIIGRLKEDLRDRWLDLVVRIRHSRAAGFVSINVNGKRLADYHGPTAYSENLGYPPVATFYFKMGLYRDDMKQPMKIYIDDYSKTLLSAN